ncbi:MAG TPA: chromate efflux transporter [Candidatus Eisenbacteria bacterium]|nr:chromate efflux transporter [Candidatus Eisenbacteria bacterium]
MTVTVAREPEAAERHPSLLNLAFAFLKIGTLGFGGGMAIIALMERELVGRRRVIEADEFLHGVGLGQLLGPFAVNTALFAGYRLYGTLGGLVSACAFMAPSLVLVLILSWLYFSYHAIPALQSAVAGLGPVVIALILSAAWSMGRKAFRSWITVLLCAAATIAGLYRINPVYVLVAAGILGLVLSKRLGVNGAPPVVDEPKAPYVSKELGAGIFLWPLSLPAAAGGASLVQLFFTFFTIGLVFFGGGFVLIPVLHQTLVVRLGWLSPQEFIDGVAISNLTPGPISVLATFAGYRLRGIAGALAATAALYFPAVIVMLILCRQYERLKSRRETQAFLAGVAPAVIGLVLSTAMLLASGTMHSWRAFAFTSLALLLLIRWRLHPALILALGAVAGTAGIRP